MVGPAAKREAVVHLCTALEMSERRACTLIAADRTMVRFRHLASFNSDALCAAESASKGDALFISMLDGIV